MIKKHYYERQDCNIVYYTMLEYLVQIFPLTREEKNVG